ncbi:M13 family metallopeptidase [Alteromonas facilis]|uniref:M13 family metallopeptidase n=1 Tax=Alteromonas facilis TaxID=2048004 RepID=UPI000C288289|nr:M13 family metallopeptidase [Alteromonas facilis]
MKKSLLALTIATSLGLAACSPNPTSENTASTTDNAQPVAAAAAEIGSFGVDLTARNEAVKPGDDFFMYASGNWYDNYELPADKTRFGAFSALADRSEERVKSIIDELNNATDLTGEAKLIADFYHSFMDTESLNAKGIAPIQPILDDIKAIASVDDLTREFGKAWLTDSVSPLWAGMWYDRLDPNKYQVNVGVGGLGLPDRDYYLSEDERFVKIREAYQAHIAEMLAFTGSETAEQDAAAILELETKIAEVQWPREKRRNRDLTLNQIEREGLSDAYPNFNWSAFFESSGYQVPTLNINQPEPVNGVIALINELPLDAWKAYMSYHTINSNSDLLSEDISNASFAFYGKTLSGQQEQRARWKRAVSAMSGTESLGFAIGKVYVDRFFPESSKQQMSELVENLRTALGERIENLDWMGEETKKNAQAKLAAFNPKIGYPDVWEDFTGLDISRDDLVANMHSIRQFFHAKELEQELEPTDRNRWGMTPQRVNAYYNSSFNEIVFPAAILQPPFFDPNADPAVNYGAIGAVIGHEMGHGFDDQGSKSDAMGIQRNWWTEEDRAAFEAKTEQLIAQYSAYEPIEGNFVNGKNSLGENIGDVGGLAMAYHAYKLSLNGEEAPIIDGTTGDQRFFLAWAQVWKEKRTEESMLNQLRGGTHSPGRYRALAPRNHDAWYEAFNVQPGDALYLAPEDRVRIW